MANMRRRGYGIAPRSVATSSPSGDTWRGLRVGFAGACEVALYGDKVGSGHQT